MFAQNNLEVITELGTRTMYFRKGHFVVIYSLTKANILKSKELHKSNETGVLKGQLVPTSFVLFKSLAINLRKVRYYPL